MPSERILHQGQPVSFHQDQPDEGGDVPPTDTDMLLRLCGFNDAADEIARLRVQVVRLKVEIEELRAAGECLYVASHAGFSDRLNDAKLAWRELRR